MSSFDAASILIVLAAILGYLNSRIFHLPHAIGLVIMGAVASLALVAVDIVVPSTSLVGVLRSYLRGFDFQEKFLNGMLSFLIFAGALQVDLNALMQRRWMVLALATIGVVISTVIVGTGFKILTMALGFDLSYLWCLVFGALISPTDPIAVMSVLKTVRVPVDLEAKIAGESLFNDGAGIVSFSILLAAAVGAQQFSASRAMELFVFEAGGGILLGLVAGWVAFRAMRSIDDLNLGLLVTLALVMGGFALSHVLDVSGPVAMAIAGLFIGNRGARFAMSRSVRARVTGFWELVDQILNSILFLLIGLEVVSVDGDWRHIVMGGAAVVLVLIGRAVSVWLPMTVLERSGPFSSGSLPILVWGGVRGGISIALALSIPDHVVGGTILTATYLVVVFSVVVQGATIRHAVDRFVPSKKRSLA